MRVLHLSDTTLSGAPGNLARLWNKYSGDVGRHMVWNRIPPEQKWRIFPVDLVGSEMDRQEVVDEIARADILHFHNRYLRQKCFFNDPSIWKIAQRKPCVIQMQSPRGSEDFTQELASTRPISVVAQYQVREWPEAEYIVPNVVDIFDPAYMPRERTQLHETPVVCYSPSNFNATGRDDKGYGYTAKLMKQMAIDHQIKSQIITSRPHADVMTLKRCADIGIDEIATGSYHMSSLEFLSLGVACIASIDHLTFRAINKITGVGHIPWVVAERHTLATELRRIINHHEYKVKGLESREWMEKYWQPRRLCQIYREMYEAL